jgi:hypothetical protein
MDNCRCRVRRAAEGEALSLTDYFVLNAASINRINRKIKCYRTESHPLMLWNVNG